MRRVRTQRHQPPRAAPRRLLLAAAARLAAAGEVHAESATLFDATTDVTNLYPDNFATVVQNDSRSWVVDFYADWCGHCIHFAPKYSTIAAQMKQETRLRFGALNCAEFSDFCAEQAIHSFPTLKVFHISGFTTADGSEAGGHLVPRMEYMSPDKNFMGWLEVHLPDGWYKPGDPAATTASSPAEGAAAAAVDPEGLAEQAVPPADHGASGESDGGGTADQMHAPESASRATLEDAEEQWVRDLVDEVRAKSVASQHLWDAKVALMVSMQQGTFLQGLHPNTEGEGGDAGGAAAHSDVVLQGEPLAELCMWLGFVAGSFPSAAVSRDVARAAQVACSAEREGRLELAAWHTALQGFGIDEVPAKAAIHPAHYWANCATYTCGLWSLFHVLTVAAAEAQSSRQSNTGFLFDVAGDFDRTTAADVAPLASPQEALVRIRGFVGTFFGCSECVTNFVSSYDSCELGRCSLSPDDGEGAALWLWEVHNHVTLRVAGENGKSPPEPWPTRDECPTCSRPEEEGMDSSNVYAHLRSVYWEPPPGRSWWIIDDAIQMFIFVVGIVLLSFVLWQALSGSFRHGKTT